VRHTRFLRCAAALALLATAACDGGTTAEEPLNDVYSLVTVDGSSDPMVFADHTYPSGTRQIYIMAHDSLRFVSATELSRRFTTVMVTLDSNGTIITPNVIVQYHYAAQALRRGNRIIVEYQAPNANVKPDTFQLRDGNLVRHGPFGASCADCAPVRHVEYVYGPR
jgi:hypothetical protein